MDKELEALIDMAVDDLMCTGLSLNNIQENLGVLARDAYDMADKKQHKLKQIKALATKIRRAQKSAEHGTQADIFNWQRELDELLEIDDE